MFSRLFRLAGIAVLSCGAFSVRAADELAYNLYARDVVRFTVFGEPEMTAQLRVSGNGAINLPLLGDVEVAGLSLAAAQEKIEQAYIDAQIFIRPQTTLQVVEYSKKEISVLGQVGRQGKIELPVESVKVSIVNAITMAGGFSRIARGDAVRVTRKQGAANGEEVFTVNVEQMIAGKSKDPVFYIFPGDVVFVPERLF